MSPIGKVGTVPRVDRDPDLYEADEHEWLAQQSALLHSGRLHELDREHLAEFLDDMAIGHRRELRSRFLVLLHHLLKLEMQPARAIRSWSATITEQQDQIKSMFRDMPSIAQHAERLFAEAYPSAVRKAAAETGILAPRFPGTSPWSIEEALAVTPEMPERRTSGRKRRAQGA